LKTPSPPAGLSRLRTERLDPLLERKLEEGFRRAAGSPAWRCRKLAEARDLCLLSQIAPARRLAVLSLDFREGLRAMLALRVPVPRRPAGEVSLVVDDLAVLGLTYPAEAIRMPQPGYRFVHVLSPSDVFHANVAAGPVQALCLGASLPAGIPVREIVLAAYGALSLQSVQVDEYDPVGVLNVEAARWWQANPSRIPLTRTPFLGEGA